MPIRRLLCAVAIATTLTIAPSAGAQPLAIGCGQSRAPLLCSLYRLHARTNHYRAMTDRSRLVLVLGPYPKRRPYLAWLWSRRKVQARTAYIRWQTSSPAAVITRIFGAAAGQAIAVAECESHLNPLAHNPSGAAGLFQLMPVHWEAQGYDPYNAATNTRIAYHLYRNSGWSAWVCRP